jgi:hypothetical protein
VRYVVDLEKVTVTLSDALDLGAFGVLVKAPPHASARSEPTVHRLGDVLAATNVGTLQPDGTARLRSDAVAFHAAGMVDEEWERRFGLLCDGGVVARPATVTWPTP